jgi:hypothetical protein
MVYNRPLLRRDAAVVDSDMIAGWKTHDLSSGEERRQGTQGPGKEGSQEAILSLDHQLGAWLLGRDSPPIE